MDLTDRRGSDGDRIEFLYSRSPIMAEFMVHDILYGTVRSEICQLASVLEPFGDRHLQLLVWHPVGCVADSIKDFGQLWRDQGRIWVTRRTIRPTYSLSSLGRCGYLEWRAFAPVSVPPRAFVRGCWSVSERWPGQRRSWISNRKRRATPFHAPTLAIGRVSYGSDCRMSRCGTPKPHRPHSGFAKGPHPHPHAQAWHTHAMVRMTTTTKPASSCIPPKCQSLPTCELGTFRCLEFSLIRCWWERAV
jgi:hypothetical protein